MLIVTLISNLRKLFSLKKCDSVRVKSTSTESHQNVEFNFSIQPKKETTYLLLQVRNLSLPFLNTFYFLNIIYFTVFWTTILVIPIPLPIVPLLRLSTILNSETPVIFSEISNGFVAQDVLESFKYINIDKDQ